MQQHLMHIQPTMAAYYPTSVTTDHIQQYLDENKSLILKIVESQNSGKMSECADLNCFLAAIADSQQPQPPTMLSQQYPPSGMSQPGASHYMQSTTQQMNPHQPLTAATVRSSPSMLYGAQTYPSLQHHQQAMHGGHLGVSLASSGGLMLHGEPHVGTSMGLGVQGFPDFIRGGNNSNNDDGGTRGFGFGGSKLDMGSGEGRADAGETLYLKSANEGH